MERDYFSKVKKDIRMAHFLWSAVPENGKFAYWLDSLLQAASEMGAELSFRVKGEVFENSESARAIAGKDLETLAKRDGSDWVFRFVGRQRHKAGYRIQVEDVSRGLIKGGELIDKYNFVIEKWVEGGWAHVGIFRANEVDDFRIQKR